ncbi:hypothetical protein AAG906_011837 [Vitis piasezkii]
MKARLGPQEKKAPASPRILEALKARLGQLNDEASPSRIPTPPPTNNPTTKAPFGSISRQLDDMFSTSFGPHIINYEIIDHFDYLIHFRDVPLCKVFMVNLHGLTLSWFHQLLQNSINSFRDVSKAFVGYYLCFAR